MFADQSYLLGDYRERMMVTTSCSLEQLRVQRVAGESGWRLGRTFISTNFLVKVAQEPEKR